MIDTFFVFLIFFEKVILALFLDFEAKRARNGSKNRKTYFVNMFWNYCKFCTHHRVRVFLYLYKSKSFYPSWSLTCRNIKRKPRSLPPSSLCWNHGSSQLTHPEFHPSLYISYSFSTLCNRQTLVQSKGIFFIYFQYFIQHCSVLTDSSAAPQIQLCRRMLRDRTQDSCDFDIGCQTL
jgi:hypothetical protein